VVGGNEADAEGFVTSSSLAQLFDPETGEFTRLPDAPVGIDHALLVAHEDRAYAVSGTSDFERVSETWSLAPGEDAWREEQPIPTARFSPTGGVIGDRLYVVGGNRSGEEDDAEATMEIFDFERGTWETGPAMPTPRHHASAAVIGDRLYVVGGRGTDDLSLPAVERFDPGTGEWEQLPDLPEGVGGPATVTADGELIVIAGGDDIGEEGIEPWVTGAVWALGPEGDGWERLPNLEVPRHGHDAAIIDDEIYVIGGSPCAGYGFTGAVEALQLG
ncbi:MAG TPA: kelch repeat-containing protein, partial [Solirubrobacterales bacterium]|nr:kelch repeat-containing protein [Solirubrobacterales bacterium]